MGGLGGIVEVDETFIGNDRTIKPHGQKKGRGYAHKHKVLALVDRKAGTARTMVVDDLKATTLTPILTDNIAREARIMTDEAGYYARLKDELADHEFVRHKAEEWARGEVHTNTIEGFFSIFKRGMRGVYQHCAKKHLHRYAAEFEFRYNNRTAHGVSDSERPGCSLVSRASVLTYRVPVDSRDSCPRSARGRVLQNSGLFGQRMPKSSSLSAKRCSAAGDGAYASTPATGNQTDSTSTDVRRAGAVVRDDSRYLEAMP